MVIQNLHDVRVNARATAPSLPRDAATLRLVPAKRFSHSEKGSGLLGTPIARQTATGSCTIVRFVSWGRDVIAEDLYQGCGVAVFDYRKHLNFKA